MPPHTRPNWHAAFDTQMALYGWYRTELARDWMAESWRMTTDELEHEGTRLMSRELYVNELERLIDCDPIYVSADMCELIAHAKETFEVEPLLESDIITPRAFLFYETPFVVPDRFDNPTEIRAVSWTRIVQAGVTQGKAKSGQIAAALREQGMEVEEYEGGIRVVLGPGQGKSGELEDRLIEAGAEARGIAVTLYATTKVEKMHGEYRLYEYPPVVPIHLTPWYFDMTFDGNEVDVRGIPTGAIWWWRILQTTMRMMQQKISVKHHQLPDRSARREMQRHGYPQGFETVVVRLRGEESERKDPSGEKANYSHRFMRRGHWRMQPYPKEQVTRQIWIYPTIVGDSDLPLIVKPRRAFQWSR